MHRTTVSHQLIDYVSNGPTVDHSFSLAEPTLGPEAEFAQPAMLNATLKSYQLKGVNWLANLYTQVI